MCSGARRRCSSSAMEGLGMERLWAPWRMEFILQEKGGNCFLCDAVGAGAPVRVPSGRAELEGRSADADRELLVLERGTRAFVIMNRYPYNNGHLLVAPNRHGGEFGELTPEESAEVMALAQRWQRIICEVMKAEGFNLGLNLGHCAGAGVPGHVHVHIVPRWEGDTNFMPVLGETRVIPELLVQTYDRLLEHVEES